MFKQNSFFFICILSLLIPIPTLKHPTLAVYRFVSTPHTVTGFFPVFQLLYQGVFSPEPGGRCFQVNGGTSVERG